MKRIDWPYDMMSTQAVCNIDKSIFVPRACCDTLLSSHLATEMVAINKLAGNNVALTLYRAANQPIPAGDIHCVSIRLYHYIILLHSVLSKKVLWKRTSAYKLKLTEI